MMRDYRRHPAKQGELGKIYYVREDTGPTIVTRRYEPMPLAVSEQKGLNRQRRRRTGWKGTMPNFAGNTPYENPERMSIKADRERRRLARRALR